MIPVVNLRYLIMQGLESSENEVSLPVPSTLSADSTSSIASTSARNSVPENNLAVPVPSSARAIRATSPMPSTSSMPRMFPVQISPVHRMPQAPPMQPVYPVTPIFPMTPSLPMTPILPVTPSDPRTPAAPNEPEVPSTSHGTEENSDDFRFEAARLSSFRNWPLSFINPASLAAAGFYYTGKMDRVICFECQLMISYRSMSYTPMQIHEMRSPGCRFVRNIRCNNVPIGVDPDKVLRRKRRNRNISCPYGLQYQQAFESERLHLKVTQNPTAYEFSRMGLKRVKEPEYLQYVSYECRLNSFATWPEYMTQKSEELADAGFYYTGENDFTICYHCGIPIQNWRPFEDPWEQHAISSPTCCYLLTVRGCQYVNNVTGNKLYEDTAEEPLQIIIENDASSSSGNKSNEMTLIEKVAALKEENRALKDARSCKVCMEREATIIFLPCGHLATCHYCSPAFAKCIICQREIKAVTRVFLA